MADQQIAFQQDWDPDYMRSVWPRGLDSAFILDRQALVAVELTAAGARGPVLEVGSAEGNNVRQLGLRGLVVVALDPSPGMVERAGAQGAAPGARVAVVRGIGETLPFVNGTFDRVLCESALDHVADPARAVAEMARVLRHDGRLVIGFVNYGGATVRASRLVYGVARSLGTPWSRRQLFWDSPVPHEHTFECTYPEVARLCAPYFEPDGARGVSIGWAFPGWGRVLGRLPKPVAVKLLWALDRVAWRVPRIADYVVTVWRPR